MTADAAAAADATTLPTPAPADLPASDRGRILIYLGVLIAFGNLGAPFLGLISLPVTFFLKNRLHLHATEVAGFLAIAGIPLYFSFLWGFVRDTWNPFGRGDRGYMIFFGAICAALYAVFAFAPPSYALLLGAIILLTCAFLFVQGALAGLSATIARQHVMSGQMSTIINIAQSFAALIPQLAGGFLSDMLEGEHADLAARTLFLVGGAILTSIALFAIWRPRIVYDNVKREHTTEFHPFTDMVRLLKHWPAYPALLIWTLWNFAPGSATPLQYYLQDTLHAKDSAYGLWNAIFSGCFIPTFMLFGAICRRFTLRTLLFWGTIVAVPQMVPLLFASSTTSALIAAAPIGLMGGVATAAYLDLLIRSCPKGLEGTIIMMSNASYFLVSRLGDILGTHLYDHGQAYSVAFFGHGFGGYLFSHFGGFGICVVAITVVYGAILPTLWLVPRRLTATPDGQAPEGGFDAA